ncbi:murein biosynthesis integral membrane protein MurJ [Romboutsia hominis]|uniref:murein biosynthesis integral membrane protein MurJ n=1 Tax=Romboutsia hominis TaxID=1507512 RepID=UPI001F05FC0F|nr:murein biosynthesis integral membrane protein MurJ [Romboutsia hominis]MCH1960632.1 murein biosynthesis integral membrane protein MurJ [Romboutsia hominis]MCH1968936.1 murein biosynthesis integral membrane protein MurJ [Romboutsia hominis]
MSKVAKATIGLMIATILAKVLGFGRELVLASSYGASMYSDAYITAMNIPLVIFATIGTTLATVLIPMYFEVNNNLGEKEALKFTNNVFNIVVIMCLILGILGLVFTDEIVKVFAVGFKGEAFEVAVNFTRVTIVGIVFTGLSYLMTAYLQINNNFAIPGMASIPKNIIMIASIILSVVYNPYIMIWGTLLGMAAEFLFQLPFAIKNGYKYSRYINIKDKYLKKMSWLIMPVLIGVAVNQINTMVDRTLASTLGEGSISALNYANKLNGFVMALFIASIGSVIYPMLSKLSTENNKEKFTESVVKSINSVILLVVPISIGAIVLAIPIVRILFERGEFDARATSMTAIALAMYSLGMLAFGLRDILGKVFYSIQDTKTPMINGAIAMGMNIVLNIALVNIIGLPGLPLATSISATVCIFLLFINLKKKIGYFGQDKIIKTTLKSIVSAVVMGVVTYFGYNLLSNTLGTGFIKEAMALFGSIGIGALVYGISVVILKVEEINIIVGMIKSKLNKKNKSKI